MKANRGDMIRLEIVVLDATGKTQKVTFDAAQIATRGQFDFTTQAYGGEILRVEMEFEYPDGSKKVVIHGAKWADITHKIIINEDLMTQNQKELLGDLPDWKENHAMVRLLMDGTLASSCKRPGHSGDDQSQPQAVMLSLK